MFLRKMRWLCAAFVAAVAALATPAQSKADSQILIQELDGSANVVSSQTFSGTSASFSTANFLNIQVVSTPNSGAITSLNTSVTAALASGFDPSHTLQVVVTGNPGATGFENPFPDQPALIVNTVGNSSGVFGGSANVTGVTQVFNQPGGAPNIGPTNPASSTIPSASGDKTLTIANSGALPQYFSIQQTLTIRATPDAGGTISTGSSIGATAGSTVVTNAAPVPAPAGLVLALTAIPAIGLRRLLRRKTA